METSLKRLPVECELKEGRLSVQIAGNNLFGMTGLSGAAVFDNVPLDTADGERLAVAEPDACAAFHAETRLSNGVRWVQKIIRDGDSWLLETSVVNDTPADVVVNEIQVLRGESQRGFSMELGSSPETLRFFKWVPWNMEIMNLAQTEHAYGSSTLLHVSEASSGLTLMASFSTFHRMFTGVELTTGSSKGAVSQVKVVCYFGAYRLKPGQELVGETLRISAYSEPYAALESWADEAYERYKPDFSGTKGVCMGRGIWRDGFTARTGDFYTRMVETIEAVDRRLGGFKLELMYGGSHGIFKDGLPGNWMEFETCEKGDLGKLQAELGEKHHRIFKSWFSPFWFFGEAAKTFEENKGNLLCDQDGKPYCQVFNGGWEFGRGIYNKAPLHKYFLDGTHPKTHEFLKKVFTFNRAMGIRAYMLDFLSSIPGAKLYDESLLPVEVARLVFSKIREYCGKDTHLQTAVASSPAYIGCVNSARVVRDYGEGRPQYPYPNWETASYCRHDLHFSNIFSFMQNAASNWFTNRKIYVNDLNEMTIDNPVPLDAAQMTTTMFGLSGDSPVVVGDDITNMSPERLQMLKKILPRTKGIPVPVDLFDRTTYEGGCHILKKAIETAYDRYMLVAVTNPDPISAGIHCQVNWYATNKIPTESVARKEFETVIDFARLGLEPDKKYVVYEFWNGEYIGVYRKGFSCRVPLNACKLYRITEYREYPWLVSTDLHVEQGNAEIENVVFDPEKLTLTIQATRPVGEVGRAIVFMPRKYRLVNHEDINTMKEVIDMQTICGVPLEFDQEHITRTLQFEIPDTDQVSRRGWLPYVTEAEWLAFVKEHPADDPNRVIE